MKPRRAPLFAAKSAAAKRALRVAPHGHKIAARRKFQQAVKEQLKVELRR